jgi:hypothetical protein
MIFPLLPLVYADMTLDVLIKEGFIESIKIGKEHWTTYPNLKWKRHERYSQIQFSKGRGYFLERTNAEIGDIEDLLGNAIYGQAKSLEHFYEIKNSNIKSYSDLTQSERQKILEKFEPSKNYLIVPRFESGRVFIEVFSGTLHNDWSFSKDVTNDPIYVGQGHSFAQAMRFAFRLPTAIEHSVLELASKSGVSAKNMSKIYALWAAAQNEQGVNLASIIERMVDAANRGLNIDNLDDPANWTALASLITNSSLAEDYYEYRKYADKDGSAIGFAPKGEDESSEKH